MTVKEYNQCVDSYADGLYRFILKNIKDTDSAQDIVQDTFEKVWLKLDEVSAETAKSYLFTVAYRTMIDQIRKDKFSTDFNEEIHNNQYTYNTFNDLKTVIDLALKTLSHIQRSVILLRDYEGYSYEEIGEITGMNQSQVKIHIYRGRMALKNYLGKLENVM